MGVNTHCIGIRGNRMCLDAYEIALNEFPGADHRFRIEHSQILRQEHILGSIEKGKLADMTILDKDIISIELKEILNTKVLYTIVGGRIVYSAW